ncbi:phosphoribosyl-AMP cyclohydrolase [Pseudomonas gingeri]|uniref:phosphoribosyl-AMP cyclohydrolase n=1 Tax=Pseudomonas gingeri TaxID=117681 RepID=UPI0015A329CF|nr:phosphoribosyl-AMP cyclohydrolase [Pseudomonas gingeri]NVZ63134.1 phosphoribosyl-AMP cyclohydrolase [Pseudomonas gingeri]NVZ78753.1 phosphoribosyl-AMP cyclohydrolase [Pseudomonas gingeri]
MTARPPLSMLDLESAATGSRWPLAAVLKALPWNDDGLIAAIAQQHDSGEVLMLAWMNRQALAETLEQRQVCYWSRSRQRLWRKGESSGHRQRLVEARLDCDGDAILLLVEQQGPACHTGRPNCFYNAIRGGAVEVISAPEETSA